MRISTLIHIHIYTQAIIQIKLANHAENILLKKTVRNKSARTGEKISRMGNSSCTN